MVEINVGVGMSSDRGGVGMPFGGKVCEIAGWRCCGRGEENKSGIGGM